MSHHTTAKEPSLMTVEQFLAWDGDGHVGKLELVDGVVRASDMGDATEAVVRANVAAFLGAFIRNRGPTFSAGVRPPIIPPMGKRANARAPDLAVTCAPPSNSPTFEAPVVIVEVISPTNEADTWESIRALAGLPSLQEILIVQSTRVETQLFRRDAGGAWPSDPEVAGAGGTVRLSSIDLALPVSEIYLQTGLI